MIPQRFLPYLLLVLFGCDSPPGVREMRTNIATTQKSLPGNYAEFDTAYKVIHVLVALCDNKYQGIVPVPAKIGNGQDPDNNLYWGCAGGIRTYFKNSSRWKFLKKYNIDSVRLERVVFKHSKEKFYLVADAYDGRHIKNCTIDFLKSCSGQINDTINLRDKVLGINGNAVLLAYIGHDGLMDFNLVEQFSNIDNKQRDAIILACISKKYFSPHLKPTRAKPLVWSTGLMSPEAYTLHDALDGYIANESAQNIRDRAASAYSKYQRCSLKASKNLLVSGF